MIVDGLKIEGTVKCQHCDTYVHFPDDACPTCGARVTYKTLEISEAETATQTLVDCTVYKILDDEEVPTLVADQTSAITGDDLFRAFRSLPEGSKRDGIIIANDYTAMALGMLREGRGRQLLVPASTLIENLRSRMFNLPLYICNKVPNIPYHGQTAIVVIMGDLHAYVKGDKKAILKVRVPAENPRK